MIPANVATLPARAATLRRTALAAGWTVRATESDGRAVVRKLVPIEGGPDDDAVRVGHNTDAGATRAVRKSHYVETEIDVHNVALRCVRPGALVHAFWWNGQFDQAIQLAPTPAVLTAAQFAKVLSQAQADTLF